MIDGEKVKIGDLKLRQIKEICDNHDGCGDCPIYIVCRDFCRDTYTWTSEDLEREVEVNEQTAET